MTGWTIAHRIVVAAVLLFLPAPIVIVVLSSFTKAGYMSFPPGDGGPPPGITCRT